MSSDNNVHAKMGQHKKDRVYIYYKEKEGEGELKELPFVVGVMANLTGHKSTDDRGALDEREFLHVPGGNLDPLMSQLGPKLNLVVDNKITPNPTPDQAKLSVNLKFGALSDFEPLDIAEQVPELKTVLELRQKLANLRAYLDGKPGAQRFVWQELQRMLAESKKQTKDG